MTQLSLQVRLQGLRGHVRFNKCAEHVFYDRGIQPVYLSLLILSILPTNLLVSSGFPLAQAKGKATFPSKFSPKYLRVSVHLILPSNIQPRQTVWIKIAISNPLVFLELSIKACKHWRAAPASCAACSVWSPAVRRYGRCPWPRTLHNKYVH